MTTILIISIATIISGTVVAAYYFWLDRKKTLREIGNIQTHCGRLESRINAQTKAIAANAEESMAMGDALLQTVNAVDARVTRHDDHMGFCDK